MAQRIFVKVMGFTDVERHALNTIFRLSEQRGTIYSLWESGAPEPPRLALIDGQSYEARLELESPRNSLLKLIWVGAVAPAHAWRIFDRPLSWPDVVKSMDELFSLPEPVDFDLGFDESAMETWPPSDAIPKRALIASADRDERLYLRAKLALADLTQADEAETGAQALELVRAHHYAVALVDFALPDVNGWAFLKELTEARPAIEHVIVTKARASWGERARGWFAGAKGFFDKPPHPGKLQDLLHKV
ncbi:response regulator [Caenimonas soli]|jgi:CheY-like chemotaxis protein|uniref:response regulator n=1 Tax=Caenimonas soli TaxID=2735555 RepID=UPI001551EF61|nr:response regulator [Caenimonas soli]NPC54350.1 response regulator [Caenimonas soli]